MDGKYKRHSNTEKVKLIREKARVAFGRCFNNGEWRTLSDYRIKFGSKKHVVVEVNGYEVQYFAPKTDRMTTSTLTRVLIDLDKLDC